MYQRVKTRTSISSKYFAQSELFQYSVQLAATDCNERLLEAAEYGNVADVREQLENPELNINCTNYMGLNALQIATNNDAVF